MLVRVKEQAARMSTDSEEMENLNRTLTGIATVYELQLRNISKQVSTIEQIDEQTRRMAQQIEELNNVYARKTHRRRWQYRNEGSPPARR